MGDILEMKKGEVNLDVKIKEGKLALTVTYDGKGADAAVTVSLEAEYFVQKLCAAIPGEVDDTLAAILVAAIKKA